MDVRKRLDSVQKWWKPPTEEHEKAFEYLKQWVKVIFLNTEYGIRLVDVPEFLRHQGIIQEMIACIGFACVTHFLFHCDDILEIRAKKINGEDVYFVFLNEDLRPPGKEFKPRDLPNYSLIRETYVTTKLCSFARILNFNWNMVTPTVSGPMRQEQDNHFLEARRGKEGDYKSYAGQNQNQCDRTNMHPAMTTFPSNPQALPSGPGPMYPQPSSSQTQIQAQQVIKMQRTNVLGDPESRHNRHRARFGKLFTEACASLKNPNSDQ